MTRDDLDWFLFQRRFYCFQVFEKPNEVLIFIHAWFFRKEKLRRELQDALPLGITCKVFRVIN